MKTELSPRRWLIVAFLTLFMSVMNFNLIVYPACAVDTMAIYGVDQAALTTFASVTSVVGVLGGIVDVYKRQVVNNVLLHNRSGAKPGDQHRHLVAIDKRKVGYDHIHHFLRNLVCGSDVSNFNAGFAVVADPEFHLSVLYHKIRVSHGRYGAWRRAHTCLLYTSCSQRGACFPRQSSALR